MAKKPETNEAENIFEDELEIQDALEQLPSEGAKVMLWRMPAEGKPGRPAYIGELAPQEFSLEAVRAQWGGGRYKLIAIAKNKKRREGIFEIDGPPLVYHTNGNGGQAAAAPASTDMAAYAERVARLEERARTEGNGKNDVALFTEILKAQEAGFQRALQMAQIFAPKPQSTDVDKIIGGVKSMMEMATLGAGDGSGGTNWLLLLEKFAPTIQNILTQAAQPQTWHGTAPPGGHVLEAGTPENHFSGPRPPTPPPPQAPGATRETRPSSSSDLLEMIRPYLPTLMVHAAADKNPRPWAAIIAEHVAEAIRPQVLERLTGDVIAELATLDPNVKLQEAWFKELAGYVLEELQDAGTDGSTGSV